MSMPAIAPRRWSADDVRALPDASGQRLECVDGELLVNPSPRLTHQSMVGVLWRALEAYVSAERHGAGFTAPGDREIDAFTLVQPDVYVRPLVNGRRPRTTAEIGHPLLFVEVLSPGTARFDRVIRRARYQQYRVEHWIVDLDARLLERWTPDAERPSIHTDVVDWTPTGASQSLALDLRPLFDEALGSLGPLLKASLDELRQQQRGEYADSTHKRSNAKHRHVASGHGHRPSRKTLVDAPRNDA